MPDLTPLIDISRRYGADSAFVLAGGGNTSFKQGDRLWVKASGHALATINEKGFVELDRTKLDAMMAADWPTDPAEREAAFISAVMAARVHPELNQRPSVEALLHHLLPAALVVHTHPGLINAVTCCERGETLAIEWYGDRVLWQSYVDPGLTLAKALADSLVAHIARTSAAPVAILLANHGLIVSGDSADAIEHVSTDLLLPIRKQLAENLIATSAASVDGEKFLQTYATAIRAAQPALHTATDQSPAILWLASTSAGRAAALAGPLSPDQIVYCRSTPLWIDQPANEYASAIEQIKQGWAGYEAKFGVEPWVVVLQGVGIIAARTTSALSEITRALYADAAAVYRDAHRLGGVRVMSPRDRRFIEEWEVEAYRRSVLK